MRSSENSTFYEVCSVPVLLVSVGFLSLLHAQFEGEAGEGFLRGVTAEPRPLFFGNPASSFHPSFALWCPLETVLIFHDLILAQGAWFRSRRAGVADASSGTPAVETPVLASPAVIGHAAM
jgi:hypothetical protein